MGLCGTDPRPRVPTARDEVAHSSGRREVAARHGERAALQWGHTGGEVLVRGWARTQRSA